MERFFDEIRVLFMVLEQEGVLQSTLLGMILNMSIEIKALLTLEQWIAKELQEMIMSSKLIFGNTKFLPLASPFGIKLGETRRKKRSQKYLGAGQRR